MPYDLYGNSYRSAREAENAELAQMAEIDSRHTRHELEREKRRAESNQNDIWQYISILESRIEALEQKFSNP